MHDLKYLVLFLWMSTVLSNAEICDGTQECTSHPWTQERIIYSSAVSLLEAIKKKELTSENVVSAFINRIQAVNPKLNAIVELNPHALNDAKELDEFYQRTGTLKGRLHGIPITVKEMLAVKGFRSTFAIAALKDNVATDDCTVVQRLRNEGAVILGTTNVPEWALAYETDSSLYGRTLNPYNLERTSGGSSGGEGAIIAAGGSILGLGTDIGGSIRVPSHFSGISGLKPSRGRIPLTDSTPVNGWMIPINNDLLGVGPMGRHVEDLELVFSIISGMDYKDPQAVYAAASLPFPPVDFTKLRVGYFYDDGIAVSTEEVRKGIDAAVDALRKLGVVQITNAVPPRLNDTFNLLARLLGRAGTDLFEQFHPNPVPQVQWVMDELKKWKLSTFDEMETLLRDWTLYRQQIMSYMESFDLIVAPIVCSPATKFLWKGNFNCFQYVEMANVAMLPSLALGAVVFGEDPNSEYYGLPVGVQLISTPMRDELLLTVGKEIQKLVPSTVQRHPAL